MRDGASIFLLKGKEKNELCIFKNHQSKDLPLFPNITYIWLFKVYINSSLYGNPIIPCPSKHGWKLIHERYESVLVSRPPAPPALLKVVKCTCEKKGCQNCSCVQNGLLCNPVWYKCKNCTNIAVV